MVSPRGNFFMGSSVVSFNEISGTGARTPGFYQAGSDGRSISVSIKESSSSRKSPKHSIYADSKQG